MFSSCFGCKLNRGIWPKPQEGDLQITARQIYTALTRKNGGSRIGGRTIGTFAMGTDWFTISSRLQRKSCNFHGREQDTGDCMNALGCLGTELTTACPSFPNHVLIRRSRQIRYDVKTSDSVTSSSRSPRFPLYVRMYAVQSYTAWYRATVRFCLHRVIIICFVSTVTSPV